MNEIAGVNTTNGTTSPLDERVSVSKPATPTVSRTMFIIGITSTFCLGMLVRDIIGASNNESIPNVYAPRVKSRPYQSGQRKPSRRYPKSPQSSGQYKMKGPSKQDRKAYQEFEAAIKTLYGPTVTKEERIEAYTIAGYPVQNNRFPFLDASQSEIGKKRLLDGNL